MRSKVCPCKLKFLNHQFYFLVGCACRERRRSSLSYIEKSYDDYGNSNSLCGDVPDVLSLDRRYTIFYLETLGPKS